MFGKLVAVGVALCCAAALGAEPEAASTVLKVGPYGLARLKVDAVDPKAAVVWRVSPSAGVQRATTAKHVLEFVAPPGVYTVHRLVIRSGPDGAIDVDEWEGQVEFERCCEQVPPGAPGPKAPPAPPAPERKANAHAALGRIQFGRSGCTATVMWPRRADGRWDVLTAEHCVDAVAVGGRGVMQLRGREDRFGVQLVAKDKRADVAWLVTESADLGDLPYAVLAASNAQPGAKVWHAGFGVDAPGNREDGVVTRADAGSGKAEMTLSVSSGDSGGGIFRADTDELISTVCCTTRRGAKVTMYGGNVDSIRRLRPVDRAADGDRADWWKPIPLPLADVAAERASDWWTPVAIPEVRPTLHVVDLTPGRN